MVKNIGRVAWTEPRTASLPKVFIRARGVFIFCSLARVLMRVLFMV